MIPQHFIDDLLRRVDVVDIVGQYVTLKKTGVNYSGLCPFHTEKSPSFSVSPVKQFYHCFGCGAHGTAIGFLMDHLGLSFPQAVEDLANRYGLEVPRSKDNDPDRHHSRKAQADLRERLESCLREAARFYQRRLKDAPHAIDYLKGRGITGEIAARYHLGYAPEGWQSLQAVFSDYTSPEIVQAGLVISGGDTDGDMRSPQSTAQSVNAGSGLGTEGRRYDRFRNRIMFPILGGRGEVIGFGARTLGSDLPKYLNSPETQVFSKGNNLYGIFEARQGIRRTGEVWIVEGYMDVVALAQYGFDNVVATLGTATTAEHLKILSRQANRLVFMFDGDTAGQKAAARALEVALQTLHERTQIRFVFLPPEHDPDSFVRAEGPEALTKYVESGVALSQFVLMRASQGQTLDLPEGRAAATAEVKRLLALMPNSELKAQLAQEAARRFQTAIENLGLHNAAVRRDKSGRSGSRAQFFAQKPRSARVAFGGQGDRLLQILIHEPRLSEHVATHSYWAMACNQLAASQTALFSWILKHAQAPGLAGLFEAARNEDNKRPEMELFNRLSKPDPALEALINAEHTDTTLVKDEIDRSIRALALRQLELQATELAARPHATTQDLESLRQLRSAIGDLKSGLIGSLERPKI